MPSPSERKSSKLAHGRKREHVVHVRRTPGAGYQLLSCATSSGYFSRLKRLRDKSLTASRSTFAPRCESALRGRVLKGTKTMVIRSGGWVLMAGSLGVALSCSDPLPPPPRVAVKLELVGCNVSGIRALPDDDAGLVRSKLGVSITAPDLEALPRQVDGQGGDASCSVKESAANQFAFQAKATVDEQAAFFEMRGGNAAGHPDKNTARGVGTATFMSFRNPASGYRESTSCTIETELSKEGGGALLYAFNCINAQDPAVPETGCSITGTVVIDRCSK